MAKSDYRIADEPAPGALSNLAVRPLWPFIAIMFGGVWLSWTWFVLNGIAVGSPTKRKEWLWIAGGLLGSVLLLIGLVSVERNGLVPEVYIKYLTILLVVWKLGVTYALYALQSHTIELYEYYGGTVRNGIFVVVAALFVSPAVLGPLPEFMRIVLS